jgi:hypothetical protein
MKRAPGLGGGMICRIIAMWLDINGDFGKDIVIYPAGNSDGRE